MKVQELRIGNYFELSKHIDKSMVGQKKVVDIKQCLIGLGTQYLINGFHSDDCSPIPLTEEWLKKFDIIGMNTKKLHGVFKITPNSENTWDVYCGNGFNTFTIEECSIPKIKYVHQLQNLYFSITGEELTINNK